MWKKIIAPTVLVIVLWGLSSAVSTLFIQWIERSQARDILEDLSTIHAAGNLRYCVRQIESVMSSRKTRQSPRALAELDRLEHELDGYLEEAIATSLTPEELELVGPIRDQLELFRAEIRRELNDNLPYSLEDELSETRNREGLADAVVETAVKLGDVNERLMVQAAARRSQLTSSIVVMRYGVLIVGPITGILFGYWIARRFTLSIAQISITLGDVATELPQTLGRVEVGNARDLPKLQEQVMLVVEKVHQVNLELQDARQRVIAAARLAAVGEMSAGLAHELRNPLTSVKLLIQNAAQRQSRAMTEKQIGVVLEEIVRMEGIIEQLLDFARPTKINRVRHDLRDDIQRSVALVETRTQQAGVTVSVRLPEFPVEIDADAERISAMLRNLMLNAADAMPGGGTLSVAVDVGLPESESCTIRVVDSGAGISAAMLPRLFEPFATDKARGTGLGLAICRRIVEDHGGKLSAANREGGGAVFTVVLPCAAPDPSSGPQICERGRLAAPAGDSAIREEAHAEIAGH
jgi:signal transduction histidine kinase